VAAEVDLTSAVPVEPARPPPSLGGEVEDLFETNQPGRTAKYESMVMPSGQ